MREYRQKRNKLIDIIKACPQKFVIYPLAETGSDIKYILENDLYCKRYEVIDNIVSEVNEQVWNIADFMKENQDNLDVYCFIVTNEKHDFWGELVNNGVGEENIIKFESTKGQVLEDKLIYLIRKFGVNSFIDWDNYFEAEGLISKELFHSGEKRFFEMNDYQIYAGSKYGLPVYERIYEKSSPKGVDAVIVTRKVNEEMAKDIMEAINQEDFHYKQLIFCDYDGRDSMNDDKIQVLRCGYTYCAWVIKEEK